MASIPVGTVVLTPVLDPVSYARVQTQVVALANPRVMSITVQLSPAAHATLGALSTNVGALNTTLTTLNATLAGTRGGLGGVGGAAGGAAGHVNTAANAFARAAQNSGLLNAALPGTHNGLRFVAQQALGAAGGFNTLVAAGGTAGLTLTAIAAGVFKLGQELNIATQKAGELTQGLKGISSVTGFDTSELNDVRGYLQNLSTDLPVTTKQLTDIARNASLMGVQGVENIQKFTTTIAKLGIITRENNALFVDMGRMSEELAKFLNETGSTVKTFNEDLEGTTRALAAVDKVTPGTIDQTLRLAKYMASGSVTYGITRAEIIGLSGALVGLGANAEAGGSAVIRVVGKMQKAAYEGGDAARTWANALGVTVEQFQNLARYSPTQALLMYAQALHDVHEQGGSVNRLLDELGLKNVRDIRLVDQLTVGHNQLAVALKAAAEAEEDKLGLDERTREATDNLIDAQTKLNNSWVAFQQNVGAFLEPTKVKVVEWLQEMIDKTNELVVAFGRMPKGEQASTLAGTGGPVGVGSPVGPTGLGIGTGLINIFGASRAARTAQASSDKIDQYGEEVFKASTRALTGKLTEDTVDLCARWVRQTLGLAYPQVQKNIDAWFRNNPEMINGRATPTARSAYANFQRASLTRPFTSERDLKKGDIVFYADGGQNHVGLYIGDGMVRGNNRVTYAQNGGSLRGPARDGIESRGDVRLSDLGSPTGFVRPGEFLSVAVPDPKVVAEPMKSLAGKAKTLDEIAAALRAANAELKNPNVDRDSVRKELQLIVTRLNNRISTTERGSEERTRALELLGQVTSALRPLTPEGGAKTPVNFKELEAQAKKLVSDLARFAPGGTAANVEKWAKAKTALDDFRQGSDEAALALQYVESQMGKTSKKASEFGQAYDKLDRALDLAKAMRERGGDAEQLVARLEEVRTKADTAAAAELRRNGAESRKYIALTKLAADANTEIARLLRDQGEEERAAAQLGTQIARDAQRGKVDAARAGLEELQGVRESELAAVGDDAERRLAIEKRSAAGIRAARVVVAAVVRDAALQEAARERNEASANARLKIKDEEQLRARLADITATHNRAVATANRAYNTEVAAASTEATERVVTANERASRERQRIEKEAAQRAKETEEQLSGLTAKQLAGEVKAREDRARGLRTQRDRELRDANTDADAKLAIEKRYAAQIRAADEAAATARLTARKRDAEAAKAAALAAIPDGIPDAKRREIKDRIEATFSQDVAQAYRDFYAAMGDAADDGTERVRLATETAKEYLDQNEKNIQDAIKFVRENAGNLDGRDAMTGRGRDPKMLSLDDVLRFLPDGEEGVERFTGMLENLRQEGVLTKQTLADALLVLEQWKAQGFQRRDRDPQGPILGDNLEGRGKLPDVVDPTDPSTGFLAEGEEERLRASMEHLGTDVIQGIYDGMSDKLRDSPLGQLIAAVLRERGQETIAEIADAASDLVDLDLSGHRDEGSGTIGRGPDLKDEDTRYAEFLRLFDLLPTGAEGFAAYTEEVRKAAEEGRITAEQADILTAALEDVGRVYEDVGDGARRAAGSVGELANVVGETAGTLEADAKTIGDLSQAQFDALLARMQDVSKATDKAAAITAQQADTLRAAYASIQLARLSLASERLDVERSLTNPDGADLAQERAYLERRDALRVRMAEQTFRRETAEAGTNLEAQRLARERHEVELLRITADGAAARRQVAQQERQQRIDLLQDRLGDVGNRRTAAERAGDFDAQAELLREELETRRDIILEEWAKDLVAADTNEQKRAAATRKAQNALNALVLDGEQSRSAIVQGQAQVRIEALQGELAQVQQLQAAAERRGDFGARLALLRAELAARRAVIDQELARDLAAAGADRAKQEAAVQKAQTALTALTLDGEQKRTGIVQEQSQLRLDAIDRELQRVEQRRAAASPNGTNFAAEREALDRSQALRARRAQEVYEAEVEAAGNNYDKIEAAYSRLQIALTNISAEGSRARQELAVRELNSWQQWVDAAGQIINRINGGKTSWPGLIAGGVSAGLSAAKSFASGDIVGGILAVVDGIDKLFTGILEMDEGFQKWKKSLLEVADAERQVANAGAGLFKSPFKDALNRDAAAREENANADALTRAWWWLTGTQPKYLDDAAADLLKRKGELFNAIGQGLSNLENVFMDAITSGDWSKVGVTLEKTLNQTIGQAVLRSLLVAEFASQRFTDLVTKLVEAVRSGDKAAIAAAREDLRNAVLGLKDVVREATDGLFEPETLDPGAIFQLQTNNALAALEYQHKAGLISTRLYEEQKLGLTLGTLARERSERIAAAHGDAEAIRLINEEFDLKERTARLDSARAIETDRIRQNQAALDFMALQLEASYQNGEISTREYEARKLQLALARLDEEEAAAINAEGVTEAEKTRIHAEFVQKRADAENAARDALINSWSGSATSAFMDALEAQDFSKFEGNLKRAIFRAAVEGLVAGLAADAIKAELLPLAKNLLDARKTATLDDDAAAIAALQGGIAGVTGNLGALYDVLAPLASQYGLGQDRAVAAIKETTAAVNGVKQAVEESTNETRVTLAVAPPGTYVAGTRPQDPNTTPTF